MWVIIIIIIIVIVIIIIIIIIIATYWRDQTKLTTRERLENWQFD